MRTRVLGGVATFLITIGCASERGALGRPPAAPNTAGGQSIALAPSIQGTQGGWTSPFHVTRALAAYVQSVPPLPIDLTRIARVADSGPCAPLQIAPSIWIAPDCSRAT